jgi:hyperosmotically inducible protein
MDMKTQFAAAAFLTLGLALAPVAGQAADTKGAPTVTEKAKEGIDDSALTAKIKTAFAKDKDVSAMKINIDSDKGVVKLTGNVKSKAEADKAVAIAKGTKGVASVQNNLKVVAK